MRPDIPNKSEELYECFECGRRSTAPTSMECEDCGGPLRNISRGRDL